MATAGRVREASAAKDYTDLLGEVERANPDVQMLTPKRLIDV
jgi:hypothetical protein